MILKSGTTIGHYKVLSRIGAGGMGEVCLAEDVKLGRKVALKLLAGDFTKNTDRLQRFEREARAASALNHPNILTIYEIGESDGLHFIATEYIEGQTLRDRLGDEALTLADALDVAIQTASALAAAHRAGIVHRDIKPENIMLRPDGIVKVLDFGIAKLTEKFAEHETGDRESGDRRAATVHTEPGVVIGSPNYMSPEQARGLKVDARTDIFSLGCVIYEMISGRRPFDGETVTDVIVAVLNYDPPPLGACSPEVPDRIERIVSAAMAKRRDERCQTIQEVLAVLSKQKRRLDFEAGLDMSVSPDSETSKASSTDGHTARYTVERLATASAEITRPRTTSITKFLPSEMRRPGRAKYLVVAALLIAAAALAYFLISNSRPQSIDSLAVLPFTNAGNDPDFEYLSDGITDSLINKLSQTPNLKVMSRNSVFKYKGQSVDAQEVARKLGVRAVLLGGIAERGDTVTINIEMVDARDNSVIWSEQITRKHSDIIEVQEEIARRISEKLQLKLTGAEEKRLTKRYTDNTLAYHLYLKGRYYWNKRTEEGIKKGIEFFDQAIAEDPLYALAYAGLADCYAMLSEYSTIPPEQTRPRARAAAMRALELDDTLAEAHTSLAAVNEYDWKWAEAEKQYRRAIEMNPNYETAHHWYAIFLGSMQRADESFRQIRLAQELDPLSLIINTGVGRLFYSARQYDRAIEQLRKTIEMEPSFAEAHFQLALAYEAKGMYEEAIAEFQKATELFQDPTMNGWVGRVYALSGKRGQALKVIEDLRALSKKRYVSPYMTAIIYTALGDKDRAFEWLEKTYGERSYYVSWLKVDPVFDKLRADPRYADLLRRVGLDP